MYADEPEGPSSLQPWTGQAVKRMRTSRHMPRMPVAKASRQTTGADAEPQLQHRAAPAEEPAVRRGSDSSSATCAALQEAEEQAVEAVHSSGVRSDTGAALAAGSLEAAELANNSPCAAAEPSWIAARQSSEQHDTYTLQADADFIVEVSLCWQCPRPCLGFCAHIAGHHAGGLRRKSACVQCRVWSQRGCPAAARKQPTATHWLVWSHTEGTSCLVRCDSRLLNQWLSALSSCLRPKR